MAINAIQETKPEHWHVAFTDYDILRRQGCKISPRSYYSTEIHEINTDRILRHDYPLCEYVYIESGRRDLHVSSEILDILMTLKIEDKKINFEEIMTPWDSFCLVFERGTKFNDIPFRFIMVSRMRSQISFSQIREIVNLAPETEEALSRTICLSIDCGLSGRTNICDFMENRPIDDSTIYSMSCPIETPFCEWVGAGEDQRKIGETAIRIVASALMLFAAKPTFIVPYKLPRAQRYQHFGNAITRTNKCRIMFPKTIIGREAPLHQECVEQMGHRQPYHIRGGSLRALRHEKFKRNPDGTIKIILVEQYEVHPELKQEGGGT